MARAAVNYQHKLRNYTHHESLDMKDHEHPDVNPESVPEMVHSFKQEGKKLQNLHCTYCSMQHRGKNPNKGTSRI